MKILLIPDTQIRPNNLELNTPLLQALGQQIIKERPDVVVHIGDHWDMDSLNSYEMKSRNRLTFDGNEVTADIAAGVDAMQVLLEPLWDLQRRQKESKHKVYNPRRIFTMGNHEQRVDRFVELKGMVDIPEILNDLGWEVHDYLEPVEINGVHFCHYFYNPLSGRPFGGTAEFRLNKMKYSFVQGHEQTFKHAVEYLNNGSAISALIGGACYLHDEGYKGFQGNNHYRGAFILHNVRDGKYDLEQLSIDRLLGK
jgi:hypothetical protein